MRLTDKVSIITGAGQGIGRATALKFAAEGAKVAVCDINQAAVADTVRAILDAGGEAAGFDVDVTDKESIARMVSGVMAKWGRIDTLVNNAGIVQDAQFKKMTDEQFERVIDVNIGGVFYAARRAAVLMREQRSGTIINTTSIAARSGGGDGAGLYGSAKGFVSTITRVLAKELAPFGIRVNAVAPGVIMTPFHQRYSSPEQLESSRRGIPLGRLGTAEDCVGAYEFLASERMSGYITGQVIEVNGGQLMP